MRAAPLILAVMLASSLALSGAAPAGRAHKMIEAVRAGRHVASGDRHTERHPTPRLLVEVVAGPSPSSNGTGMGGLPSGGLGGSGSGLGGSGSGLGGSSSDSTPDQLVTSTATCTSPSGEDIECETASGGDLLTFCGLGGSSYPDQVFFSGQYVFPYADCSSNPDLQINEYASAMAYTASRMADCACKCEAYSYCSSFTWYPDSVSDTIPINCFLFSIAPSNVTLCQSSVSGSMSGLLV